MEIVDSSIIGNPYMFTGRRFDSETGLYYYRARYYDPYIGRFLQTDPIGYYGGLNLYTYVDNNPVNWIDPWGLKKGDGGSGAGGPGSGGPGTGGPGTGGPGTGGPGTGGPVTGSPLLIPGFEYEPATDDIVTDCMGNRVVVKDSRGNEAVLRFAKNYLNTFYDNKVKPDNRRAVALRDTLRSFDNHWEKVAAPFSVRDWTRGTEWPDDEKYYRPGSPYDPYND